MRHGAGPDCPAWRGPERPAARRCATRSAIDPETNKTRVQVCPFLPAAFRIPGNPGDGCKADRIVGGMTTRTD
jgi:hypothetical protein